MIRIISTNLVYDMDKTQLCRYCEIVITDNSNNYQLGIGGLPLEGDLQPILDARHDELLDVAILKGNLRTNEQVRYLLYAASWSNEAFQAAVIENIAENVGGSMPGFAEILEKFEQINEAWPIPPPPKPKRAKRTR